jgi:regulatory protein
MSSRSEESPHVTVRRAAMNLLAQREQSFFELLQKLSHKFPEFEESQVIIPALEKLREEKLQSDERFVESYVRYRMTRGMGPLKIGIELELKGVNSDMVQSLIFSEDNDWIERCMEVFQKKYPEGPAVTVEKKKKQYRFLEQRGFQSKHIMHIFARTTLD